MKHWRMTMALASSAVLAASAYGQGGWITFTQDPSRLSASPGLGATDNQEKDYAWGDLDHDGDIDLVCVRKQPFTTSGRRPNVLFMNEGIAEGHAVNGVLVDRSAQFASASDDSSLGFLDETNDRDVILSDVDSDGWLDIVTATTLSQGQPKTISHPRIYMNLGNDGDGNWLGFRYEEARIPQLPQAPNFCGVGAGDVDGDKAPDLYFVNYNSSLNDRLLMNDGNGFFTDESALRMTAAMLSSGFGTSAHIVDVNGDGALDVVKSQAGGVSTIYNSGNGFFNGLQSNAGGSAYHAGTGDLNDDGRLDIIVSDDGTDKYLLNQGNSGNGQASFVTKSFPANSSGFGGNSHVADLNNDGHNDVLIADVDVDIPGCTRLLNIFRNLGNNPSPSLVSQGSGGIPSNMLNGTHDLAVFDINGDGYKDLVIGRCSGTQVWIAQTPSGLLFNYPQGLPSLLASGQPTSFQISISSVGTAQLDPDTVSVRYSIDNAPYQTAQLAHLGDGLFDVTLPSVDCPQIIKFFFTAESTHGEEFIDPPAGESAPFVAVAADGQEEILNDTIEGDVSSWSIANDASLTGGGWAQAIPIGTVNAGNQVAAPDGDAGQNQDVMAFVTQNGEPGGAAFASDVDGGPTTLVSPVIDLAGADATIHYHRWFYCEDEFHPTDADFLTVEVTSDGASWTLVESVSGTGGEWQPHSFRVADFITPSATVRVRFSTSDTPNNSVTEAGIDNFRVETVVCGSGTPCIGDLFPIKAPDGAVDAGDLAQLLSMWGDCPAPCAADLAPVGAADGVVGPADLGQLLASWGQCP